MGLSELGGYSLKGHRLFSTITESSLSYLCCSMNGVTAQLSSQLKKRIKH